MKFKNYLQPKTVSEALLLAQQPGSVILGGMMWLHLQNRTAENAVDLSLLGLNQIEKTEKGILIGAYVTLRQAETSELLNRYTHGAISKSLFPIVGVQFRNGATVGGSVFGRFGFSDVCTLFSALGAKAVLAGKGEMPMEQFMKEGAPKDILTHILLPEKMPDAVCVQAQRNAATDFPVLTAAFCRCGQNLRVAISPAPVRGEIGEFTLETVREKGVSWVENLKFGSNAAASDAYRKHLAKVLFDRGVREIGG